jgi:hypothetical protein
MKLVIFLAASSRSLIKRLLPKSRCFRNTFRETQFELGYQGDEAFSEMPGGKALSFHGLSMGETPGPERSRGEQREGAKLPRR